MALFTNAKTVSNNATAIDNNQRQAIAWLNVGLPIKAGDEGTTFVTMVGLPLYEDTLSKRLDKISDKSSDAWKRIATARNTVLVALEEQINSMKSGDTVHLAELEHPILSKLTNVQLVIPTDKNAEATSTFEANADEILDLFNV